MKARQITFLENIQKNISRVGKSLIYKFPSCYPQLMFKGDEPLNTSASILLCQIMKWGKIMLNFPGDFSPSSTLALKRQVKFLLQCNDILNGLYLRLKMQTK